MIQLRGIRKQDARHDKKCCIFEKLFGSEPEANITPQTLFTPEQKKAQATLLSFIQGSGNPNKVEEFGGDLVAPLSKLEELSLSSLEDRARTLATQGGNPLLEEAETALIDILTRGPTDISSFIDSNIKNPLLEIFNEDVRPAVSARFADQFFGSNRVEKVILKLNLIYNVVLKDNYAAGMKRLLRNLYQERLL